ncbi:BTB/POZ domain-containing protein [Thalictrum thalictroides]|uniref:BTB/POZ domain-containing protein n=1 Tax=Thalictrum thalictroides TaxID=46969 RepID=A0A7J6XDP2_THATH|nr:BTB/POZ domain-containing protein [Thalictrum thalictroides]
MGIVKAHPWLSDMEKEKLCNIIDYRKLSIDACAHASQNERLPLRIVLQVLFFEQLQLRTALGGYAHVFDGVSGPVGANTNNNDMTGTGQIVHRGGWVTVVRENQVLRVDLEKMRSKVGELEQEVSRIKQEVHKVTKSSSSLNSPRFLVRKLGCKLLPRASDAQADVIESVGPSPRASFDQAHSSFHSRQRKSFSLL